MQTATCVNLKNVLTERRCESYTQHEMLEKTNISYGDGKQNCGNLGLGVGVGVHWHKDMFLDEGSTSKIGYGGGR